MTETMLDRVARATETYAVVFTEKALVYKTDTIGARMTKVVGEFDTAQEAHDACKRMNARAVLEVLMGRLQEEDAEANEMPDLWIQGFRFAKSIILEDQAMLAEILKE